VQRSRNDVWVGLFVMVGMAAILFLALKSANLLSLSFQSDYKVTAKFDNIGGLKPKAAVKSAGVVVGRVESITFDDKTFPGEGDPGAGKPLCLSQRQLPEDPSPVAFWVNNTSALRPVLKTRCWSLATA
jgi:hypothetical protein